MMTSKLTPVSGTNSSSLSRQNTEQTLLPPSGQDAVCPSSTPIENGFDGISPDEVIKTLTAVLYTFMRGHPSSDSLFLAIHGGRKRAEQLGVSNEQFEEVMDRFRAIAAHAFDNTYWPKDFF